MRAAEVNLCNGRRLILIFFVGTGRAPGDFVFSSVDSSGKWSDTASLRTVTLLRDAMERETHTTSMVDSLCLLLLEPYEVAFQECIPEEGEELAVRI